MATRNSGSRLETRPTYREAVTIRPAPITERLAEADRRDRFVAMWADAPHKPARYYEFTREERRANIADEGQRTFIQAGLRDGAITVDRYMDYRLWQIADDLANAPGQPSLADVGFVRFVTEAAEGLDACAEQRGMPSIATNERAVKEVRELAAAAQFYGATLERTA